LELKDEEIKALEFKYNPKKMAKIPAEFTNNYTYTDFKVISKQNWWDLISS
jgi:hypothetical protein